MTACIELIITPESYANFFLPFLLLAYGIQAGVVQPGAASLTWRD